MNLLDYAAWLEFVSLSICGEPLGVAFPSRLFIPPPTPRPPPSTASPQLPILHHNQTPMARLS